MIGQKFGSLTVTAPAGSSVSGNRYWYCQCDCGNTTRARGDKLKSGQRKSCGCKKRGRPTGSSVWTKELIAAYIATCHTKREFREHHPNAYAAAVRFGWLKELGSCLQGCKIPSKPKPPKPDPVSDAVYIWRVVDRTYNGVPVYKFGVTSATYNGRRIGAVAKEAGVRHELVLFIQTPRCLDIEKALLGLGYPVPMGVFNGSTEFRSLTDVELAQAIQTVVAWGK